jgi:cadmium resistance protein CadD (predicted permease)
VYEYRYEYRLGSQLLTSLNIIALEIHAGDPTQIVQEKNPRNKYRSYLSFLTVTAVTFSNGGDNIGVYTPMFAKYNSIAEITILVTIFMVMTGVWCIAAYYLVNHPLIASKIRRIGHFVLPFILIGLGIYILVGSFA